MLSMIRQRLENVVKAAHQRDLQRRRAGRASERGFTLVEIMVVVVIIGLIAGLVGVQVFGQLEEAQKKTAEKCQHQNKQTLQKA